MTEPLNMPERVDALDEAPKPHDAGGCGQWRVIDNSAALGTAARTR